MKWLQTVFQASGISVRPRAILGRRGPVLGQLYRSGVSAIQRLLVVTGQPRFTRPETLEIVGRALLWWLSTPLILYLAYRAPITSFRHLDRLGRNLALHIAAQFSLNLLITCVIYLVLYKLLGLDVGRTWGPAGIWASLLLRLSISLTMYLLLVFSYGVVAYATHNQTLHHQNARYELANEQLKAQLAGAQLQALKMQLNPHFLFNTHHAIIGLILTHEPERAIAMLTSLSDLLRAVLASGEAQLIPLREEMQFVTKYLDIQQIRFQDRLHLEFDIAADTQDCPFPQFLLQPLVENALVHGLEQQLGDARLRISARREGEQLLVEVQDNGRRPTRRPAARAGQGIGLSNTRARLEKLYQGQAQLEFSQPATGGTVVVLRVPHRQPLAPAGLLAAPLLATP